MSINESTNISLSLVISLGAAIITIIYSIIKEKITISKLEEKLMTNNDSLDTISEEFKKNIEIINNEIKEIKLNMEKNKTRMNEVVRNIETNLKENINEKESKYKDMMVEREKHLEAKLKIEIEKTYKDLLDFKALMFKKLDNIKENMEKINKEILNNENKTFFINEKLSNMENSINETEELLKKIINKDFDIHKAEIYSKFEILKTEINTKLLMIEKFIKKDQ